jgi:hypothetical protein
MDRPNMKIVFPLKNAAVTEPTFAASRRGSHPVIPEGIGRSSSEFGSSQGLHTFSDE